MNGPQERKPGREYRKVGRTLRRVPIPMKPPVPCVIVNGDRLSIDYNEKTKNTMRDLRSVYIFPSRTQARKALWHILQDDSNWPFGPYEVIAQKDLL